MKKNPIAAPPLRHVVRTFSPEERERWLKARMEVEQETPELEAKLKKMEEAAQEPTLSGALRRALHQSGLLLPRIATEVGLTETQVDEFLLGERTIRSDVLDRLAKALGFEFPDDQPQPLPAALMKEVPESGTVAAPSTSTMPTGS